MNVYAKSEEVRREINDRTPEDIVLTNNINEAQVLITGQLKEEQIHEGITAMVIPYVGYNQVDLALLKKHSIALFNTQVNGVFVAERALGLCLSLMGKIALDHRHIQDGIWSSYEGDSAWTSLRGKRVGLLGYGVIGQAIHSMIKPFDPLVYTIDRGKEYPGCQLVDTLEELIEHVDVLFVQVPLTDKTEQLLNKELLQKMNNKFLINVGRGAVIDEDGLYEALKNNVLQGFASDVWYSYPNKRTEQQKPSNYPICEMDHVVCTSHSAGNVEGIDTLTYDEVARQIIRIKNQNYTGQIRK